MSTERRVIELSLLDILLAFRRRSLWILIALAIGVLIALLTSFYLTPRYQAIGSLLPGRSNVVNTYVPTLERGKIRGGVKFGNVTTRNSQNLEVMTSDHLQTLLIAKLSLVDFYGYGWIAETDSTLAMVKTLQDLRRNTYFGLPLQLQVLFVEVHCTDPDMAARIANTYLDLLDQLNLERYRYSAARRVQFLDTQLDELQDDILTAQARISEFQRRHGVTDLEREWDQVFELNQMLQARLLDRQLRLGRIAAMAGPMSPERIALEAEIDVYLGVMEKLDLSLGGNPGGEATTALDLKLGLNKLNRQFEQLRMVEEYLIAERESARLQSIIDLGTTTVLDRAHVPSEPIWPDRKLMIGLSAAMVLFLGGMLCIIEAFLMQLGDGNLRLGWGRLLRES